MCITLWVYTLFSKGRDGVSLHANVGKNVWELEIIEFVKNYGNDLEKKLNYEVGFVFLAWDFQTEFSMHRINAFYTLWEKKERRK